MTGGGREMKVKGLDNEAPILYCKGLSGWVRGEGTRLVDFQCLSFLTKADCRYSTK